MYRPRKLLKWALPIISICLIAIFLSHHITILKVDGVSMEPTLHSGERIISTDLLTAKPGDVCLVHFISMPAQEFFVKRLIATEGQSVIIKNGVVYVDGKAEQFGPNVDWTQHNQFALDGQPLKLIPGWSFVLGDNRNASTDSRELGLAKPVGKVLFALP